MTLVTVAVIVALLAGSMYAVWQSHEEAKAAERRKVDRIMQASTPRAPGYPSKRVS